MSWVLISLKWLTWYWVTYRPCEKLKWETVTSCLYCVWWNKNTHSQWGSNYSYKFPRKFLLLLLLASSFPAFGRFARFVVFLHAFVHLFVATLDPGRSAGAPLRRLVLLGHHVLDFLLLLHRRFLVQTNKQNTRLNQQLSFSLKKINKLKKIKKIN